MGGNRRPILGLGVGAISGLALQQSELTFLRGVELLLFLATASLGQPGILVYIPAITLVTVLLAYTLRFTLTINAGFGQVSAGVVTGLVAGYSLAHLVIDLIRVFGGLP